jgi:two-component system response regulator HydG
VQKELVSVSCATTAHGFRLSGHERRRISRLVDEGKFHEELFYRVASLPVHLPPLRDRD